MDISNMIKSFAAQNQRQKSKPYFKICKSLLLGSKPYSLNSQPSYWESEYLASNIRASVEKYSSNKDMAITLYKDLVSYLKKKDVAVPEIKFPPIPVSNSFERLMFIAKYLQESDNKISRLKDILWVSDRTIEEDLKKLRDSEDPIQV